MSMSTRGSFSALAEIGFDSPNIQTFHSAVAGTTGVVYNINGVDPNASASNDLQFGFDNTNGMHL